MKIVLIRSPKGIRLLLAKLFGVEIEGDEHDPKNDVLKMKAYMEKDKEL